MGNIWVLEKKKKFLYNKYDVEGEELLSKIVSKELRTSEVEQNEIFQNSWFAYNTIFKNVVLLFSFRDISEVDK